MGIKIKKKNGVLADYDNNKIIIAVNKAANRVMVKLTEKDHEAILDWVKRYIKEDGIIDVNVMHNIVETSLEKVHPIVARSYKEYRNYKRDFVHMMDDTFNKTQSIMYIGDKDNANSDSALCSTQQSLVRGELTKNLYDKFYMNDEERQACKDGYIYIHDKKDRMFTSNCCIFDIGKVLEGGFESANMWYNEPTSVRTAISVIGDIMLSASANQYGGFTVRLDDVLPKYCKMSYDKYMKEYLPLLTMEGDAENRSISKVIEDLEQGIQGLEYKLNTMASSRGDFAFTAVAIGLNKSLWGREVSKAFLKIRKNGQGPEGKKRPVVFPKLLFLHDTKLHGKGCILEDVFDAAIECSSKAMYPDFISLDAGYTGEVYEKWGEPVISMG